MVISVSLFLSVAFTAKPGTRLLLFLQELFVATHALLMKSFFQIRPGVRPMASRAANPLVSLLQFGLVKDILPVFVDVMAILTGDSGFDMPAVRERNRGPCFIPKRFRMIQDDLIRLRVKDGPGKERERSEQNHHGPKAFPFHAILPPEDTSTQLHPTLRGDFVHLRVDAL